ncbi:hypothetical protein [Amycolatopsis sp. Poz14]|uniref:hypothetical protein n=1 Tax=Amycolatopsis sp. Poz14 TaxID=1447705 RepID=UPI001EE8E6C4|nr:hypothetical protein [Amycolatopsis sp. Poz14]MCG3753873.1 hypothetical protein [Amycolatopsis sp. Poz14]
MRFALAVTGLVLLVAGGAVEFRGADQPWDAAVRDGAQAYSTMDTLWIRQRLAEYAGYTGEQVVSALDKALGCGKTVSRDHDLAVVTRFSSHGKGLPDAELTVKARFSVPGAADPQLGFCGQFADAVSGSARGRRNSRSATGSWCGLR